MIYFLQPITGGPVKIGCTDDLERRRRQIESRYGRPLAILATMEGGRDEERNIHERFASLSTDSSDLFRPGAELMAFLDLPPVVDSRLVEPMGPLLVRSRPGIISDVASWMSIPEWPGYEVSDDGEILSIKGLIPRLLVQWKNVRGYKRVVLCRDGKPRTFSVHRIVLLAFRGECPPGMETRHLDGNPSNNRIDNLAYGTPRENAADRERHGTALIGERNHRAKLSSDEVFALRARYAAGEFVKDIAETFGICKDSVRLIATGRGYRDAEGPLATGCQERKGPRHPNAKLTAEQVAEIRRLRGRMSARMAAEIYNVSRSTVGKIYADLSYRSI